MEEVDLEGLKDQIRRRGVPPEPYIKVIDALQKFYAELNSHTQLDLAHLVLQAFSIILTVKHKKFHTDGGQDERDSAAFN